MAWVRTLAQFVIFRSTDLWLHGTCYRICTLSLQNGVALRVGLAHHLVYFIFILYLACLTTYGMEQKRKYLRRKYPVFTVEAHAAILTVFAHTSTQLHCIYFGTNHGSQDFI